MSPTPPFEYAIYPDLKHKRVLVTGGGTGIGAVLTSAFAQQGAQVYFVDIAEEASRALESSLAKLPKPPKFFPCDLTKLDAIERVFAAIEADGGPIHVLVNNAANDDRHTVDKVTGAYWEKFMNVNLRHLFFCSQAAARGMKKLGGGTILNFGSISWHLALPELTVYQTAKAAIEGLTHALARDLGPDNIRVNTIIPGAVRTPRQEALWHNPEEEARILAGQCLKTRVEPHDVAAMTLFLASDNARHCSGREYYVDNGWFGA